MTELIPRTGFSDLLALQKRMNRVFEPFFSRFTDEEEELLRGTWVPAVDVCEEGDRIVVRAELPGMTENDIEVQFENGMLTIRGERKFEKGDANYYRIERAYGSFVRSFTLPRTVDGDQIAATYRNGVLEVNVPKKDEAKPRQIRIGIESQ